MPKVNQKIKIVRKNEIIYGTIQEIYPPCEEHTGRIICQVHEKFGERIEEFWFSDIDKTLFIVK